MCLQHHRLHGLLLLQGLHEQRRVRAKGRVLELSQLRGQLRLLRGLRLLDAFVYKM